MLTWMNKQGVRSDLGFEFQFTGRFSAEYRENGKVTKIYVQGARPVTIYQGSIEGLWSDIPDPAMRDAERNRIIQNISVKMRKPFCSVYRRLLNRNIRQDNSGSGAASG